MDREIILTDETREIMEAYLQKQWRRQEKRLALKEAKRKERELNRHKKVK